MKQLRKLTGSILNFGYSVEYTNLLPYGKTETYEGEINCNKTKLRRLDGVKYEIYDWRSHEWDVIDEAQYFRIVHKHKTESIVIRNKKPKVYNDIPAADLFSITDHFTERVEQRFQHFSDGSFSAAEFILKHGYRIVDDLRPDMYANEQFVIYEPVTNMYVLASEAENGIVLITTFEPTDKSWFKGWLSRNKLTRDMLLLKYVREQYVMEEV